jgi:hypothetical protein
VPQPVKSDSASPMVGKPVLHLLPAPSSMAPAVNHDDWRRLCVTGSHVDDGNVSDHPLRPGRLDVCHASNIGSSPLPQGHPNGEIRLRRGAFSRGPRRGRSDGEHNRQCNDSAGSTTRRPRSFRGGRRHQRRAVRQADAGSESLGRPALPAQDGRGDVAIGSQSLAPLVEGPDPSGQRCERSGVGEPSCRCALHLVRAGIV